MKFIWSLYLTPINNIWSVEAEIDSAAYHVLRARMKLGLFDDPNLNPYNKISPSVVGCEKHSQLALEAARQSIVLLKNNKKMLPLNPQKIKSIAVVGINPVIVNLAIIAVLR
jgi:beta-glucosidase